MTLCLTNAISEHSEKAPDQASKRALTEPSEP